MEERLGELMVGAVERMLPLLNFQGIEEELRREPENSGSESWRRWEQRLLTRLLLRVTEVVALQQEGPGSREETGEKHNLCERKDNLVEGRGVKRVFEYGGKDQNKRQKKDHNDHITDVEADNRPDSPSLLLDPSSQELDEEDQELVDVLAQMAEEARVSTSTSLVKSNPDVGGKNGVNTNLNQSTDTAPSGSAGATRRAEGAGDDRVGQPPQVHRASSSPATTANICNSTNSGIGYSPPSTVHSSSNMIIPSRTPSLPAPSSQPWWASRKVKLRSKTSTVSTPLPDGGAERRTGGAESVETKSENVASVTVDDFEKGKNTEEISGTTEEESVDKESEESAGKEEDKGSSSKEEKEGGGGKTGKSRGARRAEKRKLRREETPHA